MIQEKMSELLLLSHVLDNYFCNRETNMIKIGEKYYNYDKIYERYKVLMKEFLSPYVINNDSKE